MHRRLSLITIRKVMNQIRTGLTDMGGGGEFGSSSKSNLCCFISYAAFSDPLHPGLPNQGIAEKS